MTRTRTFLQGPGQGQGLVSHLMTKRMDARFTPNSKININRDNPVNPIILPQDCL